MKRLCILSLFFVLAAALCGCAEPQAAPVSADASPALVLIEPVGATPSAVPLTPAPTAVPPTPEPTGALLKACRLQALEREYLSAHPIGGRDIEEVLSSLAIDPEKPMLALTFDDGPSNRYTTRILDVLEANNARATFFVVGNRVEEHLDVVGRAISLNCEIGSHTWGHSNFTQYKSSVLVGSLTKTDAVMMEHFGYRMRLFRPTYGSINSDVRKGAAEMGYPLILWSTGTHDWSSKDADKIYAACMAGVDDGAIILFHDLYDATAEAIARIVPELVGQGYQLVTVSELLYFNDAVIAPGESFSGWTDIKE